MVTIIYVYAIHLNNKHNNNKNGNQSPIMNWINHCIGFISINLKSQV